METNCPECSFLEILRFMCDIITFPCQNLLRQYFRDLFLCCNKNGCREWGAPEWCGKGDHININCELECAEFRWYEPWIFSGQGSCRLYTPCSSWRVQWGFWLFSFFPNIFENLHSCRYSTMSVCCSTTMHCWRTARPLLSLSITRTSSPQWR